MVDVSSQTLPRFTPRELLNSKETVLFDTRPHFLASVGWGRVAWFFIGSLLVPAFAAGIAQGLGASSTLWYALVPWFLLVLLPLLIPVLEWRHEFYSLSDQRIMHGHGILSRSFDAKQLTRIGGMLDVSTYRITGVSFSQGVTGRLFKFGDLNFQTNHGSIFWIGVKNPFNVRRFIEEKISAFQEIGANQATYNEAVIRKVAELRTEESLGLVEPRRQASIQPGAGAASLPQTPSGFRYCSNCGGRQPSEAAYCSQCGNQLG